MMKIFYVGANPVERNHQVDLDAFSSVEELKTSLGKFFSFADPKRKVFRLGFAEIY